MREIAVRGFVNEKFNTTFGKGLFRRAVYNGSVELHKPNQKYLVDYYSYLEWESQAKSNEQMAIVKSLESTNVAQEEDLLFSWLIHYDPLTKSKERVNGYSVYSPNTRELFIKIDDGLNHTEDEWTLNVHPCRATGANKPVFVATNVDLNLQH
jgi:O-glycosyl hydrolase